MATEVRVSDHPAVHEEVNKVVDGDQVKAVEQVVETHPKEEVKDSLTEKEEPKVEDPPSAPTVEVPVTEETCKETISEPITEEVKKVDEEETPKTEVIVEDIKTEVAVISEPVLVKEVKKDYEEEIPKTEIMMAPENETNVPAVEAAEEKKSETVEEKPTTEVATVEVEKIEPEINTVAEVENVAVAEPEPEPAAESIEKVEDQKVEEINTEETKDVEPIVTKDFVEEVVPETAEKEKEHGESEATIPEAVKEAIAVAVADVSDEKKEEDLVIAKDSVPADEIAVQKEEVPEEKTENVEKSEVEQVVAKDVAPTAVAEIPETKEEEPKVECLNEPATIEAKEVPEEKPVVTEPTKVEEAATTDAPKENGGVKETDETASKVEKPVDETAPKEEEKSTTSKPTISIMGKVKKSFMKAKKAITGKSTTTSPKTPVQESKEEEKPEKAT